MTASETGKPNGANGSNGSNGANGSNSSNDSEGTAVDTLIVGFGFSSIPLIRELERRGQSYTIISEGEPIWQQLAQNDRLDFDLVSSFHASFYAEDQVAAGVIANYYPTAKEFYAYHERLFAKYRHKVVSDTVCHVDNYPDRSVVQTKRGRVYNARHLVFATGLGRPQNETIKELDLRNITGQTLVFNAIGDTTNMMVAKAVPQGNKVILLNDGFMTLDKYVVLDIPGPKSQWYIPFFGVRTGKRYTLDLAQLEGHTVERLWPQFYKDLIAIPLGPPDPESAIARWVLPHAFYVKYPETYRRDTVWSNRHAKAGLSNGLIGIKYYPIDMYEQRFGPELEERVRDGVLMNDIVFFHTEGLVETWPKDRTSVDLENKTIAHDGKLVRFDHFIDGGREEPRLPPIVATDASGTRHAYSYDYRDSYLGVVPAKLKNIYFIGYTRPFTGGIANMNELQSLLVHKLITKPAFSEGVYGNVRERIAKYNDYFYPHGQSRKPTDHLVHYGAYTNEVAHCIGIQRKLRDAVSWRPWRTLKNLTFELLHPNNALKFRMQGEYKVEGAEEHCRKIADHYEHWSVLKFLFVSVFWDKLLGLLCAAMLFTRYGLTPFMNHGAAELVNWSQLPNLLGWGALSLGLGALWLRYQYIVNLASYSLAVPLFGLKASLQPLAMLYIAFEGKWWWCLALFGFWATLAWAFRQFFAPPLSGRYLFADCKYKHKYRPFWTHYREVYLRVRAEQLQRNASSAPPPLLQPGLEGPEAPAQRAAATR